MSVDLPSIDPASVDVSLDLSGKIALVTGGSRGIGRSVVDTFLRHGAVAISCGRGDRPDELNESIDWLQCDVSKPEEVSQLSKTISDRHGPLSVLVNNAGVQVEKTVVDSCLLYTSPSPRDRG